MYNFSMPSTLKAWFDHVFKADQTFEYTAQGPRARLRGAAGLSGFPHPGGRPSIDVVAFR